MHEQLAGAGGAGGWFVVMATEAAPTNWQRCLSCYRHLRAYPERSMHLTSVIAGILLLMGGVSGLLTRCMLTPRTPGPPILNQPVRPGRSRTHSLSLPRAARLSSCFGRC